MVAVTVPTGATGIVRSPRRVIIASSLGTVFEWYDFFLYGSLAAVISKQFFAGVSETTGFMFALLTWAAGFAVRPLGALVFGRLGDSLGRKRTFLMTIVIMGTATAVVGILPTCMHRSVWSPRSHSWRCACSRASRSVASTVALPSMSPRCAIVAITGNIYSGLWYPVLIAAASACVGAFFLPDTHGDPGETSVGPIATTDTAPIY